MGVPSLGFADAEDKVGMKRRLPCDDHGSSPLDILPVRPAWSKKPRGRDDLPRKLLLPEL
jgi:hypothetical protein